MTESRRKILLSLCGISPAVITETFYCLTHEFKWIPDEVTVITTKSGSEAIKNELFEGGVWETLTKELRINSNKAIFSPISDRIRIIPSGDKKNDAEDIMSNTDNLVAADFIMETLRQFTENDDNQIVFSIAGGRKTMTALAALAMSMLGREGDRLCHVLVNPPFDNPSLQPKFYFPPRKAILHKTQDGKIFSSADAKIILCEIPFVRLRYLFIKKHLRLPGAFSDTVNLANSVIHPEKIKMPDLELKPESLDVTINNISVSLSVTEFALYWFLAIRAKNASPPLRGQKELAEEFSAFCDSTSSRIIPEIRKSNLSDKNDEQIRKIVHTLSVKIKKAIGNTEFLPFCLPCRDEGIYGIALPPESIFCPRNTD